MKPLHASGNRDTAKRSVKIAGIPVNGITYRSSLHDVGKIAEFAEEVLQCNNSEEQGRRVEMTENTVTIKLDEMIEALPRYGIGRSGQCFVRLDDVVRTINCFFSMWTAASDIEDHSTIPPKG